MIAVITGASKGIGKAIAEKFVLNGFHVAICARHDDELQATAKELQALNKDSCILALPYDLSDKEACIRFGNHILETFSSVDVLINNAGAFIPGDVSTEEEGVLEKLIAANLYSAYHLTRTLIPSMISAQKGHIFNMSSVAALKAYPQGGSYSISKYALEGFSKNLREEMKPLGIKVTTVNPGATLSDSWKGSNIDENRVMKASDIADTIWSVYNLSPQAVVEEIVLRPQLGDL
jgi:NADP-dependent 3-hydroxy acid dehydrogenase YdfG